MTVLIMILSSLVLLLSLALLILRQKLVAVSELMRMARGSSKFYHEAYLEMASLLDLKRKSQEPLRQALSMAETEARKMKKHLDYYVEECVDMERLIKLKDEELNELAASLHAMGIHSDALVLQKTRQLAEAQEALRKAEERWQAMAGKIVQVELKPANEAPIQ